LPVLGVAKDNAKKTIAKSEMAQLVNAIQSYHSTYGKYPVSKATMLFATSAKDDFTFGNSIIQSTPTNNSEVISIFDGHYVFPGTGLTTTNNNHDTTRSNSSYSLPKW